MNGITATMDVWVVTEAEMRYTPSGLAVLNFLANVRDKTARLGDWQRLRVSVWGELAQELHEAGTIEKGLELHLEGRLRLNNWTTKEGEPRSGLQLSAWSVTPLGIAGVTTKKKEEVLGKYASPPPKLSAVSDLFA